MAQAFLRLPVWGAQDFQRHDVLPSGEVLHLGSLGRNLGRAWVFLSPKPWESAEVARRSSARPSQRWIQGFSGCLAKTCENPFEFAMRLIQAWP